MTYFVIYNPELGNALVGVSDSFESVPNGLVMEQHDGDIPNLNEWYWHPGSLTFLKHPSVVNKNGLTKLEFLRRFTQMERISIREFAKTDMLIDDFMQLLDIAEFIDIKDIDTSNALQYLAYKTIINPNRIGEILA